MKAVAINQQQRSQAIDGLRGIAMILMALDHARDFFTQTGINPTDLATVTTPLFLTRWITHLCAPVFVFLAGTGAYLSMSRGKSRSELSLFLMKRGFWLIFLEFTIIRLGWTFHLTQGLTDLQVFWAIGWAMVTLALVVHWPAIAISLIGLAIIFGHNLLDSITSTAFGSFSPVWKILHEPGLIYSSATQQINVLYPILPWIGVIFVGFGFGAIWQKFPAKRIQFSGLLGGLSLLLFVSLRLGNTYGDPSLWQTQETLSRTALSFVNVTKYPPSLLYLLLTLGTGLLLLAAITKARVPSFLSTFGKVPLFYYVAHLFVLHGLSVAVGAVASGAHMGFLNDLLPAYMAWGFTVLLLYPGCKWFLDVKSNHSHPVLSYL